jgi:hypothetical protein
VRRKCITQWHLADALSLEAFVWVKLS